MYAVFGAKRGCSVNCVKTCEELPHRATHIDNLNELKIHFKERINTNHNE